jgi:hypothetical protein
MDQNALYLREVKNTGRLLAPRSIFKATAFNHLSYGVNNYAKRGIEKFMISFVWDEKGKETA